MIRQSIDKERLTSLELLNFLDEVTGFSTSEISPMRVESPPAITTGRLIVVFEGGRKGKVG